MVSDSRPLRRMFLMASATVMLGRSSMYSVVMIDPAESSGYFKMSLMSLRVSASACFRMRFTTFAGISSTRSTASSTYSSSTTSLSSLSEKPRMRSSCRSGSSSANVSAARSFGSSRNRRGRVCSSRSSNNAAISAGFMVTRMSRRAGYFFCWVSASMVFSRVALRSAIGPSSFRSSRA